MIYKRVFFNFYRLLPSAVDAMTIEDYAVAKADADSKLDILYEQGQ